MEEAECSGGDVFLKTFLILSSGSPLVQRSGTILCNFGGGHYEEHFCEFILKLDQLFKR